ncbi:MAG: HAD family hydrolase, partial [Nitrospirae bacterium]|nr:HAD family hydrolase [Nitrospirota bacterium]
FRLSKSPKTENVTDLIDRFWVLVQESQPTLFPDVPGAIEQFWQAGYVLIVISSCSPSVVEAKMSKAGISKYFKLMLGTDYRDTGMTKGKEHFKIIRQVLNMNPTQFQIGSALIGDGKHDMTIAKDAGIVAIGRLTGNNADTLKRAGADYLVKDFNELACILGRAGRESER